MSLFNKHKRGDICFACCCSGPEPCEEEGCKGFVHLDVVGEDCLEDLSDCWWIHNFKCDTCGSENYDYDHKDRPVKFEDEND